MVAGSTGPLAARTGSVVGRAGSPLGAEVVAEQAAAAFAVPPPLRETESGHEKGAREPQGRIGNLLDRILADQDQFVAA